MIDFHNHILPNIDDGSKSLAMSIEMLENASSQGITDVVNTVHFQHPKVENMDISFHRIKKEIEVLQKELDNRSIPIKIHMGSEVFYLPNLLKIKDDPLSTIGNGKYMLVEFHPHHIPDSHRQQLFDLKIEGVTPIIAHPERYKDVQEDIHLVSRWIESGCLIQVDAGSPLGLLGPKAKLASEKILINNWCQVIGSDAHNNGNRNFCLKECINHIEKLVDFNTKVLVHDNPKHILNGTPIRVDIDFEDISTKSTFFSRMKNLMGLS